MKETQLEKIIIDFVEQKFSILVCTTIIESGIDMPNVNTIIVNRADHFGLSQLYQLRGRVGRSTVQAYSYFLTPSSDKITADSKKRLEAIITHQELGSGFHIASHDLEIRGAGNLLGAEQSGQVTAVGIEMYTDMLDSVIKKIQGKSTEEKREVDFKLNISAIIPPDYIGGENDRLSTYKDMFSVDAPEDLDEMKASLRDRFGPIPSDLDRLFLVADLKRILRELSAVSLAAGRIGRYEIKFGSLFESRIDKLKSAVELQPEKYCLLADYTLVLSVDVMTDQTIQSQDETLLQLQTFLEPLAELMKEEK
jgi:transcription-repair coupling factor (superfamily II helicase)